MSSVSISQTEIEIQHDAEDAVLRFNVRKVDDAATLNWMALMRRTYAEAAREICLRLPPSRERSMALTKLEEAMFWTSAAAARANGTPDGYGDVTATAPPSAPSAPSAAEMHRAL